VGERDPRGDSAMRPPIAVPQTSARLAVDARPRQYRRVANRVERRAARPAQPRQHDGRAQKVGVARSRRIRARRPRPGSAHARRRALASR
jgi:hypothetical protein